GNENHIKFPKRWQNLLCLADMDLSINVIPNRIVIGSEGVDPFQLKLPVLGIQAFVPHVQVLAKQNAVFSESTADVENRSRLKTLNHRHDGNDVMNVAGRHLGILV